MRHLLNPKQGAQVNKIENSLSLSKIYFVCVLRQNAKAK